MAIGPIQQAQIDDKPKEYTFLTGLYDLLIKNPTNTVRSYIRNANTISRIYSLPDKSGTFALMDDVGAGGGSTKLPPVTVDFNTVPGFGTGIAVVYPIIHNANHLYPIIQFYGQTSEEQYMFGITNRTLISFDIWSSVPITESIVYTIG